ncbi:MAG: hypothetical protein Q4G33_01140 [bacterium]|nr:hypothetical protein [bacterium]
MNKKKLISLMAVGAIAVQSAAMPILANAEASATYITNSDFKDVAVGGATGDGYYGLGIIMDGSPWLTKGSASVHYETYMRDDTRGVNYCNFWSNSDKSGSGDGAGSMYVYQRDTTSNFAQTYGYCQFDIRMHSGVMALMLGSFTDATSSTDYLANTVTFTADSISAYDGAGSKTVASIKPDTWYTVKIMINNKLQECSISVTDMSGKVIGTLEEGAYQQSQCDKVRTWCFGYVRGNTYDYDLTNVTIAKSTDAANPFSVN